MWPSEVAPASRNILCGPLETTEQGRHAGGGRGHQQGWTVLDCRQGRENRPCLRAYGGLVRSRCSVNVPEEEEDSAGSSLNPWRIQGPGSLQASWGQSRACQSKITSHPHPTPPHLTHSHALFPAAWLPVDVVAGPGDLTAQCLSRNWVCAPALADKRRVGVAMRHGRSQVVSRPDKGRPRQEDVRTAGCPGHLRRPGTARADLAGLGGTYRNQLHCPFKTRIFQSHFQI